MPALSAGAGAGAVAAAGTGAVAATALGAHLPCCAPCLVFLSDFTMKHVRGISARPICAQGMKCQKKEASHLTHFCHPDDDDYGVCMRVNGRGKKAEFATLRQCYNYMDPYKMGYVRDKAALRVLLKQIGYKASPRACIKMWKEMDTDGNDYISFPEFIEWAAGPGRRLGFPRPVGLTGKKGEAGEYSLECSHHGCQCKCYIAGNEQELQADDSNWVADEDAAKCKGCKATFGLVIRKHHCRKCGQIFCDKCTSKTAQFSNTNRPERICEPCNKGGLGGNRFCGGCGHKKGYHAAAPGDQIKAVLPETWDLLKDAKKLKHSESSQYVKEAQYDGIAKHSKFAAFMNYYCTCFDFAAHLPEHLKQGLAALALVGRVQSVDLDRNETAQIQQLVDASTHRVWTGDRGRFNPGEAVPSGYEVVRVERNENVRLWLKYSVKKALMLESLVENRSLKRSSTAKVQTNNNAMPCFAFLSAKGASEEVGEHTVYPMRTSESVASLPMFEDNRPDAANNEWYLWHGSAMKGIKAIVNDEFKIWKAGSATGTLYGKGTYLSDSITKADEYTKSEDGLYCALLCRVMGGRVKYTDEQQPEPNRLQRAILEGPYDSVFGDREKCRGTFKEMVIYESAQAYPEYLVYYKRKNDPDAPVPPMMSAMGAFPMDSTTAPMTSISEGVRACSFKSTGTTTSDAEMPAMVPASRSETNDVQETNCR